MPNLAEVMTDLEAAGSAQTRKTNARHGIKEPMFGVSYATFKGMAKKIKVDHALALDLWDTGNYDARIFALMIADPKQADAALLEAWLADCDNYGIVDALNGYVSRTVYLQDKAEVWSQSPNEWPSTAGWGLFGYLALNDKTLSDAYFEPYLAQIESGIHQRHNRTRYAMNGALISIGCRSAALHERIKHIATAIGEVYIDHGDTSCETPIIVPYIEKVVARKGYVMA
jgi:3-methyladenine DNA glycosylase AlkD